MSKAAPNKKPARRGRPPVAKRKSKSSFTCSPDVLAAASKRAAQTGESLSHFISRAIQSLLLNS